MIGRILIVDDEVEFAEVMQEYIQMKGYEAEISVDGPSAIKKIETFKPHLVLLDVHMPMMDGLEVLERISSQNRNIGIIMVTALRDDEIGRRALELGAADFITKPVDVAYFEKSVLSKIVSVIGNDLED